MSILSDEKLIKLKALNGSGGFWYITKQNLVFRDLCFVAKILDTWNDRDTENYEKFFDRHKTLSEYGNLSPLLAHRATKNCEYIGLTQVSSRYSAQNLTPFYFALKKLCNGDFDNLSFYPDIIDKQLERIFINSQSSIIQFSICPFMFLFKILLLIGDISGEYKISTTEFKLFVATAQKWNEYFEVIESILRYRSDVDYKNECAKNTSKVNDVRYNVLAQNHSQLEVTESAIALCKNSIKDVRRKVYEYELNEKIHSIDDIFASDIVPQRLIAPLQQIYYGAPGTGKSHEIKKLIKDYNIDEKTQVFRTTFHPDSDYSTFVGAYKPTMDKVKKTVIIGESEKDVKPESYENKIIYTFTQQSFLKAYIAAWNALLEEQPKPIVLVIEEINRGNCAQIFGDLFQLLDRDENGVSEYPIKADDDLCKLLQSGKDADGADLLKNKDGIANGELRLPSNLYIWATMNTSDQSLFPIDSAFKRRWDWEYMPIKYKNTDWIINIKNNSYSWVSFQSKVNAKILDATNSEDKMLGDYFVNPHDGIITEKMLLNKILFYLWNDVCKDGEGDIFKISDTETVTFSELHGEGGSEKLIKMMEALGVAEFIYETDSNEITDPGRRSKPIPKYLIDGGEVQYTTPKAVQKIVQDFATQHTEMSVDDMINFWNEISERKSFLVASWKPSPGDNQPFANTRRFKVEWGDKTVWGINGWTEELFQMFIRNVNNKLNIAIEKVEE